MSDLAPIENLQRPYTQSGNLIFMILIAVVLIGALTAAVMSGSNSESTNIDDETLLIRLTEVERFGNTVERGVRYIMQNGYSESDIRFAHPDAPSTYGDLSADGDPADQVFHASGGGVTYPSVPAGINDGSDWEFYGGTAIPGIGSTKADLILVLPNVTQAFCDKANAAHDQTGTPSDTGATAASGANPGDCLNIGSLGRFGGTYTFYATPNTVDETSFDQDANTGAARPAPQACVACALDSKNHFYQVILAR